MSVWERIRFQGGDFICGSRTGGPICTEAQYRNGLCSYAYLFSDGRVMRHGEQIGTLDEIEWLGQVEVTLSVEEAAQAQENMLTDPSWEVNA